MTVILLLVLTLGCVSEYDVEPYKPTATPTPQPNEEPEPTEIETTPASTPEPTPAQTAAETYDDETFLTWLPDSMTLMRSETTVVNRTGNWGKTLRETAVQEQVELEEFSISPEYQKIAELYDHALEAYQTAGYYAEDSTTRTEGATCLNDALNCLIYAEFQLGIVERLLESDTGVIDEPVEYTIEISVYHFNPPMDMKIPAGLIIKWDNNEVKRNPRSLISEDGLWEEPVLISFMGYHEYTFNETGTFNFSLVGNEIDSRQKITVI